MGKAQSSLADLRIFDADGKAMPYLTDAEVPKSYRPQFLAFPIINKNKQADTASFFIVDNAPRVTIDKLYLGLRNTAVHRAINLSGSDDMKQWYAIDENIPLQLSDMSATGLGEQELNFPASTYQYYKIQVVNGHKESIAITRAGIYQTLRPGSVYDLLPQPVIAQQDSAKTTTIKLQLNDEYVVNKVQLMVSSPRLFNRTVTVYAGAGKYLQPILDTSLSSTNPELKIDAKTKQIAIKIFNDDNPPLVIKTATLYGATRSVIAYLEKGAQYHLLFGDEKASAPNYDLKFFKDSLGNSISPLNMQSVENNPLYHQPVTTTPRSMPSWGLWLIIAAVITLLGLSTFKMMGEIKKRE